MRRKIEVRQAKVDDLEALLLVEEKAWPERLRASREMYESRLHTFPEGTLVAEVEGKIEGVVVVQILQVCWEISRPETKAREIKTLLKAMEKLKLNGGFVITHDLEKEENVRGKKIRYVPLWKWLSPFE